MLEGAATRAAGLGLFQLRFVTVALGLVMLALVYRVAGCLAARRRVRSAVVAHVAVDRRRRSRAGHRHPNCGSIAYRALRSPRRVLGLAWFSLYLAAYRSFVLAFDSSDPEASREPFSPYVALERIAPDYILYDPAIDAVFLDRSTALHEEWHIEFQRFMQTHHARVVSTVYDQEHNAVRVYEFNVTVAASWLRSLSPSAP